MMEAYAIPLPPAYHKVMRKLTQVGSYLNTLKNWMDSERDRQLIVAEISKMEMAEANPREGSLAFMVFLFRQMEERQRMAHRQLHRDGVR